MKEAALPTLNLSRPSANATNNFFTSAIEKLEEYSLLKCTVTSTTVIKHLQII